MMRAWSTGVVVVALAGCAAAPEPARDAGAPAAAMPSPAAPSDVTALAAFEQRQRNAAKSAAQQGHWADAIWAWDVVLALHPDDDAARKERDAAQAAAASVAADRQARARQARQRGDVDGAVKLYLEALAVSPEDTAAADALREIERARTRRGNLSGPRSTQPIGKPVPSADRNDLEHASLLASQGEYESAIALLAPLAASDARARARLADIYWQQAQRLESRDRAAAIGALRHCLQLDPGHKAAAQKLKALSAAPG